MPEALPLRTQTVQFIGRSLLKSLLVCAISSTAFIGMEAAASERPELVLQTGHQSWAPLFACRPNSQQFVSASWDSTAILWDRPRGYLVRKFTGHQGAINAIDFSRDGSQLLTASDDKTAILWDIATGRQLQVFRGHTVSIVTADWSEDGKFLVTGANDADIHWKTKYDSMPKIHTEIFLWDVATGKQIRQLEGNGAPVRTAAFSPDGKFIAACGGLLLRTEDPKLAVSYHREERLGTACYVFKHFPEVCLWDANSGRRILDFNGHGGQVNQLAFSPDGRFLLTAAHRTDNVWGQHKGISSFSPMDEDKAELFLWDVVTGRKVRTFDGHEFIIRSAAFSADGSRIITTASTASPGINKSFSVGGAKFGSEKFPEVLLWDASSGEIVHRLNSPQVGGPAILTPDNREIITGPYPTPQLWDARTQSRIRSYGASSVYSIRQSEFAPSGNQAIILGNDFSPVVWEFANARFRHLPSPAQQIAISADGQRIALSTSINQSRSFELRTFDLESGQPIATFPNPWKGKIGSIRFFPVVSPDLRRVVFLGGKDTIRDLEDDRDGEFYEAAYVYDFSTGKKISRLMGPPRRSFHSGRWESTESQLYEGASIAVFSPSNDRFVAGYTDGQVGLWIPETGKQLYLFKAHTSGVRSVVFDPTGKKFVTGSQGGGVVVWDADRRAKLQEFKGHTGAVNCITFSRDGRLVATASADDTAILWEAATGRPLYTLSGHTADINSVAISPDSKRVLTASSDGTTRLWDTTTGKELVQLINFNKGQSWVAVTREGYFDGTLDGQRLITWRIGEQVFPLELYEKQFHRPDLVSRVLRGLPIDGQATVPADRTPPQVTVEVESQEGAETVVKVTARPGGPKASIADIRVLVGGRDLGPERKRNIVREQATGPVAVFRATVDVPPGRKEAAVAAVATDDLGLQSEPAFITVRRAGEIDPASRKLYVLAVGVSKYKFPEYELLFADKDATALAANLSKQKGKAFGDVEVRVIVNEEATAENVKAGLDWLKASCKPQDVAVVLFSGHGIRGQGGLYYVTHDGDLDDLKQTCVSWRDLSDRLKEVRAWQIVFLADCCHAGSFGERGATQDELAADLVKEAGVMVFASSRGREKSIESTEWGHGAFTRALLDGLEGKADALPRDGQVTISELQAFVTDHVGKQTDDRQHPHIPRLENFDPGLVIGQVR